MINAVIIEDEKASLAHLVQLLDDTGDPVRVSAILSSVKEAREYFKEPVNADIIFSDVQLTDGHSFGIFSDMEVTIPVIFITGYNEYILNAFSCNGIDYLLKPVSKEEIQNALHKYRVLERHFSGQQKKMDSLARQMKTRKKSRLIVSKGLEFLALPIEDVVLLYTEHKLVYVIDKWGKKYTGDKNLGEMEKELDNRHFFRANRQYIINARFIRGFRSYEKVKLLIDMSLPGLTHDIVISQETAPVFRQWMYES